MPNSGQNSIYLPPMKLTLAIKTIALIAALSITACAQPTGSSSPMPTVTAVTVSPATATVAKGGTQTFSATVTGTDNPAQTVTWSIVETNKKPGTTITGAGKLTVAADETLAILTVKATSTADATKNGTATVTVTEPLLTLSGNVSISPSGTVNINTPLTASYSGSEAVSYQWEEDGTAIPGATTNTYTPTSGGIYAVTVSATGYHSKTSNAVTVNDPSLQTLSGEVSISPSNNVTTGTLLTASYTGSETVGYQWEKDGTAIPGATSATYTPTEAGDYTVIVRLSGYNPKTSGAIMVEEPSLLTLNGEVSISPSSNVTTGMELTANYTGSETVSYQWERDGTAIPGAISNTYTPTEAGSYTVIVKLAGYNSKVSSGVNVTLVFTDVIALADYLSTLPNNTADTPYTMVMNLDSLPTGGTTSASYSELQNALINNPNKYVSLNFSGSTFTSIGSYVFQNCTNLTSVTIPDGVTSIGSSAFYNCTNLTSVTIPDSVTSIGVGTFGYCSSLTGITIPDSVTSIGEMAFYQCSSLAGINVAESNTAFSSVDGVLYSKNRSILIQYPAGKTETSFIIPDSVTSIGYMAFSDCSSLASITIPDSVTFIVSWAFSGCTSLASITIPDSVTFIGGSAFSGCINLTKVTFEGTIAGADFSTTNPFPGDLRDKYLAGGGGVGIYTTTVPVSSSSVWTKAE